MVDVVSGFKDIQNFENKEYVGALILACQVKTYPPIFTGVGYIASSKSKSRVSIQKLSYFSSSMTAWV